jgi:Bacterial PH domain
MQKVPLLSTVIAIAALFLVMVGGRYLWLRRSAPLRPHVPHTGDVLVLRASRLSGIMLGFGALLPAVVLGAVAVRAWAAGAGTVGLVGAAAATLAASLFSLHQFASAFRRRIVVHEAGIVRIGVVRRRQLRWADVASVAYNPLQRWFFLTTSDGGRLWVSEHLQGIGDFAEIALGRLPPVALRGDPQAREVLEDLAAEARAAAAGDRPRPPST